MSMQMALLFILFFAVLIVLGYPLGQYLAKVADAQTFKQVPVLSSVENFIYKLVGTQRDSMMTAKQYAIAVMLFNVLGIVVVLVLQLVQGHLPFNPEHMGAVSFDSALNTAVSFVTNTNWQGYGGESTMSYLTQMLGLSVQNFLSAATGIAVVFALIRGLATHQTRQVGNFWVDTVRISLYVLLPISFIVALFMISQGVIQNFDPYVHAQTLEGGQQIIAMGPNASQETIKLLGTNGGGFFNTNSAHPLTNPSYLTNFVQIVLIFIIPVALCFSFGKMVGDKRQGWAIFITMLVLFALAIAVLFHFESQGNPLISQLGVDTLYHPHLSTGGNLEGKETRFGIAASTLFTAVTTAASCGAVNNMHDSLMPLAGLIPIALMQSGEVVFGGVGAGLYGMLIFAVLAVFIAGLMIGRTPEYLGKKIESRDMKAVAVALLISPICILIGTAIVVIFPEGLSSITNPGAHGLGQVMYALTSATNNNGSAFAGFGANTPFMNYLLALAMFVGRFGVILAVLALAGSMSEKKRSAATVGTFPTHGPLFIVLLIMVVLLIGALTFVPLLVLGPVIEHLQLFV